jgi:hypothetical protein
VEVIIMTTNIYNSFINQQVMDDTSSKRVKSFVDFMEQNQNLVDNLLDSPEVKSEPHVLGYLNTDDSVKKTMLYFEFVLRFGFVSVDEFVMRLKFMIKAILCLDASLIVYISPNISTIDLFILLLTWRWICNRVIYVTDDIKLGIAYAKECEDGLCGLLILTESLKNEKDIAATFQCFTELDLRSCYLVYMSLFVDTRLKDEILRAHKHVYINQYAIDHPKPLLCVDTKTPMDGYYTFYDKSNLTKMMEELKKSEPQVVSNEIQRLSDKQTILDLKKEFIKKLTIISKKTDGVKEYDLNTLFHLLWYSVRVLHSGDTKGSSLLDVVHFLSHYDQNKIGDRKNYLELLHQWYNFCDKKRLKMANGELMMKPHHVLTL